MYKESAMTSTRLMFALLFALFLTACGGSNQKLASNLEFTDIDGTATVEIMPETLGDAVELNRADAALIGKTAGRYSCYRR